MSTDQQQKTSNWFQKLRDEICQTYETIEEEFASIKGNIPGHFKRKVWQRPGGGGGEMSIMHGQVFEKVGVNISTVNGAFPPEFASKIPGAEHDPRFFATGISIVSHPRSPLLPTSHFNTRYIETTKHWFGGGGDLTPIFPSESETSLFHQAFQKACDKHDKTYYEKYKEECDKYFFLKHRNEPRGVGGIFVDNLNSGNFTTDFTFIQDIGIAFKEVYPTILRSKMFEEWSELQREQQLIKRGRYVEFNLLYDRGTMFGLMTNGNTEAILMSLSPMVMWP